MQGGLEIPVQVTAEMDLTERNKAILEKYRQIVVLDYKESGIDGHFDDYTKTMKASDTHDVRVCHLLYCLLNCRRTVICRHALELSHIIHNTCFFIKLTKQEI